MWTRFMDMHSGGSCKEPPYEWIYIEAPEAEARVVFYNRFGHGPDRVSCTCCGSDYSVSEHESLAQLTGYDRNCRALKTPQDPKTGLYQNDDPVIREMRYLEEGQEPPEGYQLSEYGSWRTSKDYMTLEKYLERPDVLAIRASEIKASERIGDVPEQGYVWVD